MDNKDAWAVLVGILLPLVISFLKSCSWDTKWKFVMACVAAVVAGAGSAFFAGQLVLTLDRALIDIAIVFTASQVFYKLVMEGTGLDTWLAEHGVK